MPSHCSLIKIKIIGKFSKKSAFKEQFKNICFTFFTVFFIFTFFTVKENP